MKKQWKKAVGILCMTVISAGFLPCGLQSSITANAETKEVAAVNPWDGSVDTTWYTAGKDTYSIRTPGQLAGLAQLVNQGNTFQGKTILLENDIFLNKSQDNMEHEWIPIASCQERDDTEKSFCGTFNGQNHHIYNMYVSENSEGGGLFGRIGSEGVVKCVTVSQGKLKYGGCIANCNEGRIAFCYNDSSVTGNLYANGAICNFNYALVYGCINYGDVGTLDYSDTMAGIVGFNVQPTATVSQCGNRGTVNSESVAAGIILYNSGWVYDCYNVGTVIGNRYIAGINYNNQNTIASCYFAGTLDGYSVFNPVIFADISYEQYGKVENCYSLKSDTYNTGTEELTKEEMTGDAFTEKLNAKKYTVLSGWKSDNDSQNQGFPVPDAEYNFHHGVTKIMPEAWINVSEIEAKAGDPDYSLAFDCYYNETIPEITVDNPEIAEAVCDAGKEKSQIVLKWKQAGTTWLRIHFAETENNCAADYSIKLEVTAVLADVNKDGVFNMADAALVRRYVANLNVTIDTSAADVNKDGRIDMVDYALMRRALANWSVELK